MIHSDIFSSISMVNQTKSIKQLLICESKKYKWKRGLIMAFISNFFNDGGAYIWIAVVEALQMVAISLVLAVLIGLPLGVLLVLTRPGKSWENRFVLMALNIVINVIRSIPFIILLFFILPFTKMIVGTTIGVKGVIVPLVLFTAPYIARLM